jgi:hypothetical protein
MQSGKILPLVRSFFSSPSVGNARNDGDSKRQSSQQKPEAEREPTEEEAAAATLVLRADEEFRKSALSVEISRVEGRIHLIVKNSAGTPLRSLKGGDIVRLAARASSRGGANAGRILDRRI